MSALRSTALAAFIACALVSAAPAHAELARMADGYKQACVYPQHRLSVLSSFESMVGRKLDCVLVYNDAAPTWAGWEDPWFEHHPDPDLNWANWAAAGPGRKLIITQNLFPASENASNWRVAGARGDYDEHARTLARNLVSHGLGNAVIRLGHEANGTWYPDSIGTTDQDFANWRAFWRRTVLAMKSVPGARFRFDWCINAAYRAVPLAKWYPGDDVVDFVGIDAYDSGIGPSVMDRWTPIVQRPLGIRDALQFATAHRKPLSIPEWGVAPATTALSGGDNATYVNGIAAIVAGSKVAYQSYFYAHEWATQLAQGSRSLSAYRNRFGGVLRRRGASRSAAARKRAAQRRAARYSRSSR